RQARAFVQGVDRRPAVIAWRRRAEHAEAEIEMRRMHLLEELRLRLRSDIDLDIDLGKHVCDRKTNRLVIDIAVVAAIEADLETIRVTSFRKQRLRFLDVERNACEVGARAMDTRRNHQRGWR